MKILRRIWAFIEALEVARAEREAAVWTGRS